MVEAMFLKRSGARRRLEVGARTLLGIVGGYLATGVVAAFLARALPLERAAASTTALTLSFVVYVSILIGVFAASTTKRAAWVVVVPAAVCGVLALAI